MEQEPPAVENTGIEDYRAELIRLSNAGEITQSEKYLRIFQPYGSHQHGG
jgi:hypothetical protein